jgi:hypothetical protein
LPLQKEQRYFFHSKNTRRRGINQQKYLKKCMALDYSVLVTLVPLLSQSFFGGERLFRSGWRLFGLGSAPRDAGEEKFLPEKQARRRLSPPLLSLCLFLFLCLHPALPLVLVLILALTLTLYLATLFDRKLALSPVLVKQFDRRPRPGFPDSRL